MSNGKCWIYFLLDDLKIVYIGVTQDLKKRGSHSDKKYNAVRIMAVAKRHIALDYEKRWITRFRPKYNTVYLSCLFGSNMDTRRPINMHLFKPQKVKA